jgi:hypothetical protein
MKGATMLTLKAKFLEARDLPASEPYPPSVLVTVLAGTETLNLVARPEALADLAGVEQFTDVSFELRWKRVDLAALGGTGRGKAYRLSITRVIETGEVIA